MAVERRLTELVGPVGGKLHTARSRNDQVATDLALLVRAHSARAIALLEELMTTLIELAESHRDWAAPAYTHLQRAQPVYLGHHLLAYFWMFFRDARRFFLVAESTGDMPAGSGALAGLNWDLDRDGLAAELGFERPHPNSLDAVSNRDFALDYLYAASVCAMHLSRLGSEIVLWSSSEFGFCEPADSFASGSSIMPQKKNPDAAELLRGKAPARRLLAGEPAGNDARPAARLQQGHAGGQGAAVRRDRQPRGLPRGRRAGCWAGSASTASAWPRPPATRCWPRPTSPTCWWREGVPFREAHGVVAGLVRTAVDAGKRLSELDDAEMDGVPEGARERLREALREGGTLEAKVSAGGTSSARLAEQLDEARRSLADLRA